MVSRVGDDADASSRAEPKGQTMNAQITPFVIDVPQADLDDLRARLDRTRFAPAVPGDSWEYGTPTSYLRDMVERWKSFDWRTVEARLNAYDGYLTEIDGQR